MTVKLVDTVQCLLRPQTELGRIVGRVPLKTWDIDAVMDLLFLIEVWGRNYAPCQVEDAIKKVSQALDILEEIQKS